jgi:hypothetical protein
MVDAQNVGAVIVTGVSAPFILLLSVLIVILSRSMMKARATRQWPTTNGRVLSSYVGSHVSRSSSTTHNLIYEPQVMYEYAVNGKTYQCKQINYGAIGGSSAVAWANAIIEKFPATSTVQVYYNPSQPSDAVLEHVSGGGNVILIAILAGVELLLIGLVIAGWMGSFR